MVWCGDLNIDMLESNGATLRYDVKKLKEAYEECLIECECSLMNHEPTFFRGGYKSQLDHFVTNIPSKCGLI